MPDYSFIANPTGQAQGLNTLSSLLSMKGQSIQNQSNQAVLQEQNNVRSQLKDPAFLQSITDPNSGDIDFTKAIPTILKIAPTQGASILQGMASAQNQATNAKGAILQLNGEQRSAVGQYLLSEANNPNATTDSVQSGLDDLTKQIPQLKPAADFFSKHYLNPNQNNPGAFKQGLLSAGQQVMNVPQQVNAQQPNYVNTGNKLINQNPLAQTAPQNVSTTLTPGQNQSIETDIFGNKYIQPRAPNGQLLTPQALPGGKTPMVQYPAGESEQSRQQFSTEYNQATANYQQSGTIHQYNHELLGAIDQATTGATGNLISKAESIAGAPLQGSPAEKAASAYDLVGKYTERQALLATQAMGMQTNASLDAQIKANGSAQYNPSALKTITKLNDAIQTGLDTYTPGLNKAVNSSPNQIFAKRQYDMQWGANFTPQVMELYNAAKNKDTTDINRIVQSVGGPGSPGAADLAKRAKNLQLLHDQGHL